jgi:hypothetical protein
LLQINEDGKRVAYQTPLASEVADFPADDPSFVNDELATTHGQVFAPGDLSISYDSVIAGHIAAPKPGYLNPACERCLQRGSPCAPRLDGLPGCFTCKSQGQKCPFTAPKDELLSAKDEYFDLGLRGHNGMFFLSVLLFLFLMLAPLGLLFQLEGIMRNLAVIQNLLDTKSLIKQGLQRAEAELFQQRLIFKRSVRDPRVLAALLRLMDPVHGVMTDEKLNILLTALSIPNDQVDFSAAFFHVEDDTIQVRDTATKKILACKSFLALFVLFILTFLFFSSLRTSPRLRNSRSPIV